MKLGIRSNKILTNINISIYRLFFIGFVLFWFMFFISMGIYNIIERIVSHSVEIEDIFFTLLGVCIVFSFGWLFLGTDFVDALQFYRQMKNAYFDEEKLVINFDGTQEVLLWKDLIHITSNHVLLGIIKMPDVKKMTLTFVNGRTVVIPSVCHNSKELFAFVKKQL